MALREQAELSAEDRRAVDARLDRMDAARATGPWTREVLRLIAEQPGVRAPDLAASLGRETLAVQAGRPQAEGARADPQPRGRV